jgi:hypothetical protein
MDQAKYVVHVEEEYGYRDWLWVPDMTIDELRAWWQKLPTVAPFFFDGPVSFPGEIHQIYFDTATSFSLVEEGDSRVVTPLHSDSITLPDDALYMHVHGDEDSYLRIGKEFIEHAGYVSSEEAYSEDYERPEEVKEAWDKALYDDIGKRFGPSLLKNIGTEKESEE